MIMPGLPSRLTEAWSMGPEVEGISRIGPASTALIKYIEFMHRRLKGDTESNICVTPEPEVRESERHKSKYAVAQEDFTNHGRFKSISNLMVMLACPEVEWANHSSTIFSASWPDEYSRTLFIRTQFMH